MFEQKFVFAIVVFLITCGNFTLIFYCFFFQFFGLDFFRNGFSNPFIVDAMPSFLLFEPNFSFL